MCSVRMARLDRGKSPLDGHFGVVARAVKRAPNDWREETKIQDVCNLLEGSAVKEDVIAIPVTDEGAPRLYPRIVVPGMSSVHNFVDEEGALYAEGVKITKKQKQQKEEPENAKKRRVRPSTQKCCDALRKKAKGLEQLKKRRVQ